MNQAIKEIPGWMGDEELEFLYNMVRDAPDDALIVEVGAWKGRSTAALYDAMHDEQTVCTVDTWLGQADLRHTSHSEVLAGDVFLEFLENMDELCMYPCWYKPGVPGGSYLRMFSADAATLFADGSVHRVFIDGDHNSVGEDADIWSPKLVPGGVLCGHDFHWTGVKGQLEARFQIAEVIGDLWIAKAA
jgi:predicted O-methyltransferase YrrM